MVHMWTVCPALFWPNLFVIIPCSNSSIFVNTNTKCSNNATPTGTSEETVKKKFQNKTIFLKDLQGMGYSLKLNINGWQGIFLQFYNWELCYMDVGKGGVKDK